VANGALLLDEGNALDVLNPRPPESLNLLLLFLPCAPLCPDLARGSFVRVDAVSGDFDLGNATERAHRFLLFVSIMPSPFRFLIPDLQPANLQTFQRLPIPFEWYQQSN
jgi:hypothetical protein